MKINWDLMNPAKPPLTTRVWRFTKRMLLRHTVVPMHMSNHYRREDFHDK